MMLKGRIISYNVYISRLTYQIQRLQHLCILSFQVQSNESVSKSFWAIFVARKIVA